VMHFYINAQRKGGDGKGLKKQANWLYYQGRGINNRKEDLQ
jgi:hypothetical protein